MLLSGIYLYLAAGILKMCKLISILIKGTIILGYKEP